MMEKVPEERLGFVVGYVDSYGSVNAQFSKNNFMHSKSDKLHHHPFRWSTYSQEFCPYTEFRLSKDERVLVLDWLERNGYYIPEDED